MIRLLAVLLMLAAALPAAAQGFKPPADLVRASLLAEPASVAGGTPFTVAIRMAMKPGWHVYWRNPGDSGLPPEMTWTLPAGFSASAIQWPAPHRIPIATLMNFGYEGEAILLVRVTSPPSLDPAAPVALAGRLTYLVCEKECIPGSAELDLTLPATKDSGAADPANAAVFARARAALPTASPWPARLSAEGDRLVLNLDATGLSADRIRSVAYFPYSETAIDNAAAQPFAVDAAGLHVTLTRAIPAEPVPTSLPGVLAIEEDIGGGLARQAFAIGDEPSAAGPVLPAAAALVPAQPGDGGEALTLWGAAGLALLGGLILNLMPCVFPVLSIKVLSLVGHSGEAPARVRLHGLAYTAGVLAAFLALAGLLIALKSTGAAIGWGFQLQSPAVVAGLAYLLFAIGLSLSGLVAFGGRFAGIGDGLTRRGGLEGSFFTGVLATVVATPCTAPFMGSAVGFALTQVPVAGLTVFASLGLGLALPFLALTLWPPALRLLPRPGAWMDVLKQALAFPVYATVAWLIWVLAQQVGPQGLLAALIGLVLVGFSAWVWAVGRDARPFGAQVARGLAVLAVLAVAALAFTLDRDRVVPGAQARAEGIEPFTQGRLDALLAEGRPVFVNMTAAWCITCAVNERTSLSRAAVTTAMRARDVAYLKGDWTNQNPEITRLLERHGRSGVPLYLLYAGTREPLVLPQILTEGTVLTALDAVKTTARSAALDGAGTKVP